MSHDFPTGPAEEVNPFAPPRTIIEAAPTDAIPAGDLAAAEAIRSEHIGHEVSIKSIGALHYLGAFFGVFGGLAAVFVSASGAANMGRAERRVMLVVGLFYLVIGGLHLALGRGLQRLQTWARWTDVVLISLSLSIYSIMVLVSIAVQRDYTAVGRFGLAALIPGYILYLLLSSKASTIFSPEYRAIVARTPHIKKGTSAVVKAVLAILIMVLVALFVVALFGLPR